MNASQVGATAAAAGRWRGLAHAAHAAGRLADALPLYRCVLVLAPADVASSVNIGVVLRRLGRAGDALRWQDRGRVLAPDERAALINRALALVDLGRPGEAERALAAVLVAAPADPDGLLNMALSLMAQDRSAAAQRIACRSLRVDPGAASALYNLALARVHLQSWPEAARAARGALVLAPTGYKAWANVAWILKEQARPHEAVQAGRRALAIVPDDPLANWVMARPLLQLGRLAEGWRAYAWRFAAAESGVARPPMASRPWTGQPLTARRIVVWPEQGIGDQLRLASCLPDLVARAGSCVVVADRRLVPLLVRSLPAARIVALDTALAERPAADYDVAIGDLPRHLRPDLASFPTRRGYLRPSPEAVAHWRRWLAGLGPGLKVGLSWRSSVRGWQRQPHYADVADMAPVLDTAGCRLVGLQLDARPAELAEAAASGRAFHVPPGLDLRRDIDGLAALVAALDVVVSTGNTLADLAGAVGAATIRFEYGATAWAHLGQPRLPWTPQVRSLRRRPDEGWSDIMSDISRRLARLARWRNNRRRDAAEWRCDNFAAVSLSGLSE